LLAAEGKKKVKPAGREKRKMMSSLVCLWPGKRGKERRWFRWGERLRVSVRCCGEEKKIKSKAQGGGFELAAGGEKKERESWLQEKQGGKAYFVPILSSQKKNLLSMKISPIYRAGKRVILSSMGKTSQPLIRLE
jgi:hypothetical protein